MGRAKRFIIKLFKLCSEVFYSEDQFANYYNESPNGFPGGSEAKASACNAGDLGSIPGSGRSPGEGIGNPLQYSCRENPMDGGAWWVQSTGLQKVRHD